MSDDLFTRYRRVRAEVDAAAHAAGRTPEEVFLLPVSKTVPAPVIRELYEHGLRDFGENRVPVLEEKAGILPEDIRWHFIGQLQSNKVRKVVKIASVIHSVDSAALAERIDRIAGEEGRRPRILVEINVSGEASKSGAPLDRWQEVAVAAAQCRCAQFAGLMTMAPFNAAPEELREIFTRLRQLRDEINREAGLSLPLLSMGMSGDFREAIACGSTLVRIGTAIFSDN